MERSDTIQKWNEEVRNRGNSLWHFQDHISIRNWALFFPIRHFHPKIAHYITFLFWSGPAIFLYMYILYDPLLADVKAKGEQNHLKYVIFGKSTLWSLQPRWRGDVIKGSPLAGLSEVATGKKVQWLYVYLKLNCHWKNTLIVLYKYFQVDYMDLLYLCLFILVNREISQTPEGKLGITRHLQLSLQKFCFCL